jgi:AP-3 complex subunit beta
MANPSQTVVAESVVVIKKLLQMNAHSTTTTAGADVAGAASAADARDVKIIKQLAKLLQTITVPQARAAIVWLVGEYSEKVPQRAPDVLRTLAKSFTDESDVVKLQVLTLASKLYLATTPPPPRAEQLLKYVLQLAKYDSSYDIRDRARLMRQLLFTGAAGAAKLRDSARALFLAEKPVPIVLSSSGHSLGYTLATLSHAVHDTAPGYEPLPDFPEVAPDPTVRAPPVSASAAAAAAAAQDEEAQLEGSGELDGWGDEYEPEGAEGEQASAATEEGFDGSSDYMDVEATWGAEEERSATASAVAEQEEDEEDDIWNPKPAAAPAAVATKKPVAAKVVAAAPPAAVTPAKPVDPLDDLFGPAPTAAPTSSSSSSVMSDLASLGAGLATMGTATTSAMALASATSAAAAYRGPPTGPRTLIVKPIVAAGLSVEFAVIRRPSLYGADVSSLTFYLRNTRTDGRPHCNVRIGRMQLDEGVRVVPFPEVAELAAGSTLEVPVSVHFASFTKPIRFEVMSSEGEWPVTLMPQPGDLLKPAATTPVQFRELQQKLSGMYKSEGNVEIAGSGSEAPQPPSAKTITEKVQEAAYVAPVDPAEGDDATAARFYAEAVPFVAPVLVVVRPNKAGTGLTVTVHTENAVIGSILLKQLVAVFKN